MSMENMCCMHQIVPLNVREWQIRLRQCHENMSKSYFIPKSKSKINTILHKDNAAKF